MFFYTPVLMISDMLFETYSNDKIEHTDTGNQDQQNRLPNPLEEEILHPAFSIEKQFESDDTLADQFKTYSFNWKIVDLENTTPPPEYPLFFV